MILKKLLKRGEFSVTKEQKCFFQENGFLVFDTGISLKTIDSIVDKLSNVWSTCSPPDNLVNRNEQIKWLKDGHYRIQDAWTVFPEIREVALNKKIISMLKCLFDSTPKPFQTLNFHQGTEQDVHSDSVHFNSEPFGSMCGVWVALENIGKYQGPLLYYPGSHQFPEIKNEMFDFTIETSNYPKIIEYWKSLVQDNTLDAKEAFLNKGQAIIWHGNLLHGGAPHIDRELSRNSQVTHYYFDGAKPWRPLFSKENRKHYFEPAWIV
ncbi:phytanoyl-CoA dioxygenase family protein [Opitutales bacterium]|nr:phytanoyl-CoA dioxygenase family protein [Opitutales bacterium]